MKRLVLPALAFLVLSACGGDSDSNDAGVNDSTVPDGGGNDTGTPDARADARADGTTMPDGSGDTGTTDSSMDAVVDAVVDAPPPPCDLVTGPLDTEVVHSGTFTQPIFATQAPGNNSDLWVVEKAGVVRVIHNGDIEGTPFLDIQDLVNAQGGNDERGLLGFAFHPGYAANGRFFVFYTNTGRNTTVAEYKVSANPLVAEPDEVQTIATWDDNSSRNHVGGMIAFGRDGMLYVGVGDGGGGGDQHGEYGNGLNKDTVLGKILRFDVDNGPGFVAAGNPFIGESGRDEIWAYGLRNPWRFSVDRATGDLFIGDVGQNRWEEVDFAPAGQGGLNFGWRAYEANEVFDNSPTTMAQAQNHTPPIVEIRQEQDTHPILRSARSITGGYVYRGSAIPMLRGMYLFGDFASNDVAGIRSCGNSNFSSAERIADLSRVGDGLSSFGEDNAGEIYLLFYDDGQVHRIIAGN